MTQLDKILIGAAVSSMIVMIVAYMVNYTVYYNTQMVLSLLLSIVLYLKRDLLKEGVALYLSTTLCWYQMYWGVRGVLVGVNGDTPADWIIAMLPFTAACFWLLSYLYEFNWSKIKIMSMGTACIVTTALISHLFRTEVINITIFLLLLPCVIAMMKKISKGIGAKCVSIFLIGLTWYQGYFAMQSIFRWVLNTEFTYGYQYFTTGLLPFNFGLFVILYYILTHRNGDRGFN